jgi:hypothetical protein
MRGMAAYTLGVLVAYIVGSVIGTQMILYSVSAMALEVTLNARLESTVNDLAGLSSSLLPIMAVSLACSLVGLRFCHPTAAPTYEAHCSMGSQQHSLSRYCIRR